MNILTSTLGIFSPGFRTVSQWAAQYDAILSALPIKPKTLQNKRCNVAHIVAAIGTAPIRSVRPMDIAIMVRSIWDSGRQFTARRVLIEAKSMMNEAVLAGWIHTNPADAVKPLPARIRRRRLTLDQWQAIHAWSIENGQPWHPHALRLALVSGQRRADLCKMGPSDVWGSHLHVIQQKTSARIALPLSLKLDALDLTLGDVIDACKGYAPPGETFIRKKNGTRLGAAALSAMFKHARDAACEEWGGDGLAPTLHECRSLSERLYRAQGIDTKTLLGHKRQSMTDDYNDDRGLSRNDWKTLVL